jgi:hypothetical protein
MKTTEAVKLLKEHNVWRRFDDEELTSVIPIAGPKMKNPKEIGIAIDTLVSAFENLTELNVKPTIKINNKLPDDVKYLFNKSVDSYQTIINYQMGFINKKDFILTIRAIEKTYT